MRTKAHVPSGYEEKDDGERPLTPRSATRKSTSKGEIFDF